MKQFFTTIDVEPNQAGGVFSTPFSYSGAIVGLKKLFNHLPPPFVTLFCPIPFFEQHGDLVKDYIAKGAEIGLLFYPEDVHPEKQDMSGNRRILKTYELDREVFNAKMTSARKVIDSFSGDICSIRFGSYCVDSDFLIYFESNTHGFSFSSSTVPSMLAAGDSIDHRLYNHVPYYITDKKFLLEIPLSVYEGSLQSWLRPTLGYCLLDNSQEMLRVLDNVNMSFDAAELSIGNTPYSQDETSVTIMQERLANILWYAGRQKFEFKQLRQISLPEDVHIGV